MECCGDVCRSSVHCAATAKHQPLDGECNQINFHLPCLTSYSIQNTYKDAQHLSNNPIASHGRGQPEKLTRDDRGLTSPDPVSSYANNSNVYSAFPLQPTSSDIFTNSMFQLQQSDSDRTIASPMPVLNLRTILSRKVTDMQNLKSYNIGALISLVTSIQAEGQLSKLSLSDISAIISLLGTLSIYPATTHKYNSSLASRIMTQSPQTYWRYIIQLAWKKDRLGLGLTDSDHYWLMRAELVGVSHPDPAHPSDCKLSHSIFCRQSLMSHFQLLRPIGMMLCYGRASIIASYAVIQLIRKCTAHTLRHCYLCRRLSTCK